MQGVRFAATAACILLALNASACATLLKKNQGIATSEGGKRLVALRILNDPGSGLEVTENGVRLPISRGRSHTDVSAATREGTMIVTNTFGTEIFLDIARSHTLEFSNGLKTATVTVNPRLEKRWLVWDLFSMTGVVAYVVDWKTGLWKGFEPIDAAKLLASGGEKK